MFNPAERLISDYVPWMDHATDEVVLFQDGSAMVVRALDGLPWEAASNAELKARHFNWNSALQQVATDGLVLHVLQCRGLADPSVYPEGNFTSPYARALNARYRERLLDRSLWSNELHLAIQLRPPRHAGEFLGDAFSRWRTRSVRDEPPEARIERLEAIAGLLDASLAPYRPRPLKVVQRGHALFSEPAEAMIHALTGVRRPVPLTISPLIDMFSERVTVYRETIKILGPGITTWAACLRMKHYPFMTWPGMLSQFLASSYRCTVTHSFRCMNQTDALSVMTRRQNRMQTAGDRALSQIEELNGAANLVAGNRMLMGDHGAVVTVFADSLDALPDVANAAWSDFAQGGATVAREDRALEAAYVSMLPGNSMYRTSPGVISSRNFCAMAPLYDYPRGKERGYWGDPAAVFRTTGGTPYRFHFHVDDVGNAFVTGRTGSGKTVLLAWFIVQADRMGAQVVLWDKDRGLEPLVRAMGGSYSYLDVPTGLAPLKALTDSEEDLTFLASLIRGLVSADGDYGWSPEEDRRLLVALRSVLSLPPQDRWMGDIRAFIGTSRTGAGARLEKWCWGNEHGGVVDCPEDTLRLDARVIGFDQTRILDNPIARGPTMATLFHRTGKLVDGRRLLFVGDEIWRSLAEKAFQDLIQNGLKTFRKLNSPVILATQSPGDGLDSPIGATIRQQTPTLICYGNPGATEDDYGAAGLGLSPKEIEIVKTLPRGQGAFFLKQGQHGLVAQLPLGELPDDIAILSGRKENMPALDEARRLVGDQDPMRIVAEFHRLRRVA